MSRKLAFVVILSLIMALGIGMSTAFAKYPERPIQMICPWGAGGGTDACSRIIATLLKKELGVPVTVVNRTGGSGAVGHTAISTAKPDGYTIGMATGEITMMHWMGLTKLTYKDLVPVCLVNADPSGVNVRADSPYKNLQDLLDDIKKRPGELRNSGSGQGGIWHVAMAGLLVIKGMKPDDVKFIPSKGAAPALQDLMAKGIEMSACSLPEAATLIEAGRVRPLAIMAEQRDPKYPDVPTLRELGIDWTAAAWRGITAPKGTPKEIVDVLEAAVGRVHKSKEFLDFMKNRGYGVIWKNAKDFGKFMAEADANNFKVMTAAGLIK